MKTFKQFNESINPRPDKKGFTPKPADPKLARLGKRHRVLDRKNAGTSEQQHVQIEGYNELDSAPKSNISDSPRRKASKMTLGKKASTTSSPLPQEQQAVASGLVGNMGSTG